MLRATARSVNPTTARVVFPTLRTGGPLNRINEKYGLNRRSDTVAIMQLVDAHKPKSESELLRLLDAHTKPCPTCPCRVRNGGVANWGKRLHEAALADGIQCTLEACRNFMYDLFVRGPLRGRITEQAALADLRKAFDPSELLFEESDPDSDARYAVDIFVVCPTAQDVVAGVQVKPESYQRTSLRVRSQNQEKNRAFGKPVHYLHYTPTGDWRDMDRLTHALRARPPQ